MSLWPSLQGSQQQGRQAQDRQQQGSNTTDVKRQRAVSTVSALACMYLKERGHVRLVTRHLQAQCRGESLSLLQSLT